MLAHERRARILAEVERHGSVRVSQLVPLLGVSDMTVRRDLDALQAEGLLSKVHGGATRHPGRSTDEPRFTAKLRRQRAEKEAIGARAATLVEPGAAIAVSAGTTTYALTRYLLDVPGLTVVTNSLPVADLLHGSGRGDVTVLMTGGVLTPSDALVGPVAVGALGSLHTDVVFLGCHGMDVAGGFTSPNLLESETNRALVACARRVVVLADSTKWGVSRLSSFAALADADLLVTDTGLPPEAREVLRDLVGGLALVRPEEGEVRIGESAS